MKVIHTPESLDAFEQEIAQLFNAGQIRAPIHLEGGSEKDLIEIFQNDVNEEDWILTTWRSHLKCLLKGVPEEKLKQAILDGKSIGLCFPEYRILSSAIVGGTFPISVGIAMGIKRRGDKNKVVCWVGDMASHSGIFHECSKYALAYDLPILWVIEDNGVSTNTPTQEVWQSRCHTQYRCIYYSYSNKYPHSGSGTWIQF